MSVGFLAGDLACGGKTYCGETVTDGVVVRSIRYGADGNEITNGIPLWSVG